MPDLTYVPFLPWSCTKCGSRGQVEIPTEEGFLGRVVAEMSTEEGWFGRVVADHRRLSKKCHDQAGIQYVSVRMVDALRRGHP